MTIGEVRGVVRVPGDKSISHRALILAASARGESRIRHILDSADIRSTSGALRALGASIPEIAADMRIAGAGLSAGDHRGTDAGNAGERVVLDCGNSGTTARLVAGVVAGAGRAALFVGDESLSRRPMRRVAAPLRAMGASVDLPPHGGLPMTVTGATLGALDWQSDVASAQVKSAILLAALLSGVRASVTEPLRSRDHTERMLRARGVSVVSTAARVELEAGQELSAGEIDVPGDPSSAAFLMALAAMSRAGEIMLPDVCLNPTRTGFLTVLRRMGATIETRDAREEAGDCVGTIVVGATRLRGTTIAADEVPAMIDELPLLACVAARAEGPTTVRGAGELRVKESDRIAAVVSALRSIGADAEELPDGFSVTGSDEPLSGQVVTHGDHRIAMAFGVLGRVGGNRIDVDDPTCVAVSYPAFWNDIERVTS